MNKDSRDRIYIATFSRGAEEAAAKYGFGLELNDLCISSNLEKEKREGVVSRMKNELERAGASGRRNFMHGPFTELTPAAIDPKAIDLMLMRYRDTLDICSEMGIQDIVLHDGYIPLIYQKDWHKKRSVSFWKEFGSEIPDGTTVYIENVFDDEPYLLMEILEEVGSDKYKICLDVGHANAVGTESALMSAGANLNEKSLISKWIEAMGPMIGHFHLHNNDGRSDMHDDINKGTLDYPEILAAIERYCARDVSMTIESREAEPSAELLFNHFLLLKN